MFGCSLQHLRNLKRTGEISDAGRGKYNLYEVAKYMLQANVADMTDLQKARLDRELEGARAAKRENDLADGLLVPVADIEIFLNGYTGEWVRFINSIRKSTGALLNNEQRKEFYRKHENALTTMADKLKTYRDNSV